MGRKVFVWSHRRRSIGHSPRLEAEMLENSVGAKV
jgi:hypothetical protein